MARTICSLAIALLLLTLGAASVRPHAASAGGPGGRPPDERVYRGDFGRPTIINRAPRDVSGEPDADADAAAAAAAATTFGGDVRGAADAHRSRRSADAAAAAATPTTTPATATTTARPTTAAGGGGGSATPDNLQNVSGNITTKVSSSSANMSRKKQRSLRTHMCVRVYVNMGNGIGIY